VVGLIDAFDFWTGVDPLLVADVDANGFITSRDATRVNQELNGIDRPELPPIPERDMQVLAANAETPAAPVPQASIDPSNAVVDTPSSPPDTAPPTAAGSEATMTKVPVATQAKSIQAPHPLRSLRGPEPRFHDAPDPIRIDWLHRSDAGHTDAVRSLQTTFVRANPALAVATHSQPAWVKDFIAGAERKAIGSNPNHALRVLLPVAPESTVAAAARVRV
jgi:hypothetical protein